MSAGAGRGTGGRRRSTRTAFGASALRHALEAHARTRRGEREGSAAGADDSMNENEQTPMAGDAPAPPAPDKPEAATTSADAPPAGSPQGAPGQPGSGRRRRRRR